MLKKIAIALPRIAFANLFITVISWSFGGEQADAAVLRTEAVADEDCLVCFNGWDTDLGIYVHCSNGLETIGPTAGRTSVTAGSAATEKSASIPVKSNTATIVVRWRSRVSRK